MPEEDFNITEYMNFKRISQKAKTQTNDFPLQKSPKKSDEIQKFSKKSDFLDLSKIEE